MFGKSSGGYGAIMHALRHPDFWSAAACHSGDMGFELCYLPDMPAALRALAGVENSIERWWRQLEASAEAPTARSQVFNMLAMAASYDPDPDRSSSACACRSRSTPARSSPTAGPTGCATIRWSRWKRQADNLRRLKALYIDCGERDQFNLLYGARRLHRRLKQLGIAHRYEEFADNHTGVDYRMDISLPFLADALTR